MKRAWKNYAFAGLLVVALALLLKSLADGGGEEAKAADAQPLPAGAEDMAAMMMALPEVPEDMQDPFIDPMKLSQMHTHDAMRDETEEERAVRAEWSWENGAPEAGVPASLVISLKDGADRPVENLRINNEKKMHLIAVSRDLSRFLHIHPEYAGEGEFKIAIDFPTGGEYRLFADFMPAGMNELTRGGRVSVKGEAPKGGPIVASKSLKAKAGGMEIELRLGHLMAGMPSTIAFTFRDLKTGKPVRDLEPYLGAVGHVIAIDPAAERFIHVHPVNGGSSGPQALFAIHFPTGGTYKLWGQFKKDGELLTVPFVIDVP